MRPTEKLASRVIIGVAENKAEKGQELGLEDLVKISGGRFRKRLEKEQRDILSEIQSASAGLPQKDIEALDKFIANSKRAITNNETPFKRKTFISRLERMGEQISDKEKFAQMQEIAQRLPTSADSAKAFFVKFANRNAADIADRLIAPAISTAEHVMPQSKGGPDNILNYISICGDCNSKRGNMPLDEWIKDHSPDTPKHANEFFRVITPITRAGELGDKYLNYASPAARNLEAESRCSETGENLITITFAGKKRLSLLV
jgi:hypothetical protein